MAIQKQSYQITGMRQDNLVGTGYSSKFAHEIMNMRLNTIGDYTTASWTTEKGTKSVQVSALPKVKGTVNYLWIDKIPWYIVTELPGGQYSEEFGGYYSISDFNPIGQANINDHWILFGIINNRDIDPRLTRVDKYDVIIDLIYSYDNTGEHMFGRVLYYGQLKFDQQHPIETITFYENEKLQKVYWTDGLNQPRVINIKGADDLVNGYDSNITTQFDFIQEVNLNETVEITKDQSGAGLFPPCTVKYAISYYHKYGQETNIVYDSPLYYPTLGERSCSHDELSGDSFYIKVSNIDKDHGFDYIRLYSIVKTTDNATPIVRIVDDKPINDTSITEVTFHDTNTTGEIIDPTIIQFIGGKEIVAHTFDQKDNTLFLGNIDIVSKSVTSILEGSITTLRNNHITFDLDSSGLLREDLGIRKECNDWSVYQWVNQLNQNIVYNFSTGHPIKKNASSQYVKHFKYKEKYRFGIQFQDNKGSWSEVVFLEDAENTIMPYTEEWNNECKFAIANYTLPVSITNLLYFNNYKKARLVCCYPTNADRHIIAQGVLAPTVTNNDWKSSHVPDVMSSWFFRPNDKPIDRGSDFQVNVLEWRDGKPLDYAYFKEKTGGALVYKINPEIQSVYHLNRNTRSDGESGQQGDDPENYPVNWYNDKSVYKVNRHVLTFHSPEIEFDETLRTLPSDSWEVVVVGQVPINSYAAKYYIEAGNTYVCYSGDKGNGLNCDLDSKYVTVSSDLPTNQYGSHFTTLGEWQDINLYTDAGKQKEIVPFVLYPFQRKSSLNNYTRDLNGWEVKKYWSEEHTGSEEINIRQSSELRSKCLSHILYSTTSLLFPDSNNEERRTILKSSDNATFNIFDSNEVMPLKIKTNVIPGSTIYTGEDFVYYGNMNNISPVSDCSRDSYLIGYDEENTVLCSGAYPIAYYHTRTAGEVKFDISGVHFDDEKTDPLDAVYTSDPVPITYKSTPHGVFFSNDSSDVLGNSLVSRDIPSSHGNPGTSFIPTNTINTIEPLTKMPYLYLAEIRKTVDEENRFGGDDNLNNVYVPCGPAVDLVKDRSINLVGLEGDTYYMRYDNLKTYPYATDDVNQIVEILSFMVETRINLDGRYDKNRGLLDNTMITNTNFNLVNKSYTQTNNTFSFLTLDNLAAELNYFSNQITWTKEKVSGEDIDVWTNITLSSTADADGTLGSINKIINMNNNLILFQDHGFAKIGFNNSTAISTESGVPLELAKTGKYTGLDYISREVGCQNKWSISKSKNGLFWIDDSRQELLTYSEGITSLSTIHGFDAFMIKQLPSMFTPWTPSYFNNFVTYYDKLSNDVYYINKNKCLAWNEQSKTFSSFYNYENVPYMMNIGSHSLMWNKGVWAARELDSYSSFFNNNKDYWMTLVCDGNTDKGSAFPADKVFNNIEYRADLYDLDGNNVNYSKPVFNIKSAWNGYQLEKETPLNGERKFNTWRVQLPRASYDGNTFTRDRMRNPFCYIKLKQDQLINDQTNRMILHDLAVYYDMK